MSKRHKKKIEVVDVSEKNGLINNSSSLSSAKRKYLNISGSSRRFIGSARRSSTSKLTVSLSDFVIDNEEFDCWEYYKSIERSEIDIDECIFTDHSNIENYTKLFNLFYSSIVLGTGNYIDDMVLIWNNFITSSGYCTETNKNEAEKVLKIFFGKLFVNISLGDIKGYYSAMIYLLISSLPCKPQITTMLRPYIIRKVMGMINESGLKNSDSHSNINSKKISKKKRKKDDSESNDDSDDYESNNKENVFSGLEQIKKNEDIVDLQLKLINCLVLFCRNMDISNNTSQIGLEGFNEFVEGLTELLIYNNEYQLKNWSEINNFKTIISRLVDYSSNGNLQLIYSFIESKNFSISRMIVIGILLLFINIGENRYIRHISDYNKIKSKRFRVIKLESVNIEIVLYSTIILFRKLIPLLIIGNEVHTTNSLNNGVSGNKNQNSLNHLVFKLIKDVIILFPEIVYPNMILIIRKISEIQYLQGVNNINSENNYYESDKEGDYELLSDSEKTYKYDNEYEIKKKEKLLYGIEVLKELSESIKNSEYYYIDNILSSKLQNNSEISNNELFLNDPFIGFVFSLYLLSSDKSDARQNIIDQIHSVLIPSIIQSSEDKYSTKMLLFDILKQSLFDEDDNSIDNIKGINSFISFLSSYIVDYKLNTIDNENMHEININYLPFKYPHLIYRRIISILPFMFHSSKPNYRIIAIDITGHILQLKSSLLLLSNFTDNIKNELNLNSIINKNDAIMEREKKIFNRLFILMDKMFNNIEYKNDIEMRDNKQINSSRTNSARQSIEWSGITMENKISDNNVNFAQCEMSLQLYNLILFLLERTKDISPNVRIKSISILSLIITAIYELMNGVVDDKKSFVSGISAIIDDFVQSNKPVIPIMDIIIELVFDEKAICRKGSLLLWDSFFSYIKSKNVNILNKKSYILQIFKKTLTDSSIIVRRHSLQSLYALYCYSPQYKWISNMWINYGLPTIIDTENIIVDKTTEICYNMLLEQIKKLSEYMINYNNNKDNVYDYIMNMKSEYVFSWISLKSNKENQIQTISLYRICIRNIIKKYPLLLQPLVEFLNTLIDFFIKLFNHSTENNLSDKKIEFPDLPFIIMEEIYVYINQNSNIGIQDDNLYLLTENIYKILEICVMNEYDDKKIISSSISLNNLLLITNSLLEIYKLIMSSYNIHVNTGNNKTSNKLLSSYEKIIYNNCDFYSRLTKMLIDYDEFDKSNNIFLRTVVSSSSLSTILYLIYLWDEVNGKKNSNKEMNSWILKNKKLINNSDLKCIFPEISEKSKNIELIYTGCINKLSIQINKIRQNVTNNVFLNVRILGELFLLNYTLTNINTNSPNKEKKDIVKIMKIIDSNNIELIIPYIEELYKYYGHIYSNYQNDGNNDINIKHIESIMSVLILALGQGCYSNNNIANNIIKNYLIPDVLDSNAPLSIRNNIVILLHDLYILHTTLVDPHLSNLFSLIIKDRKENNSEDKTLILRKQAIILLSDLIGQGYIKLRGAYFLKLLNSLVDRNNNIRNIAHGIFERILLRTNTSILVQNFVETMCYLNNWLDHPCIKALNINDKMSIMKNSELIIQGFNEDEKKYIFKFIFNHLSDKQKNEIIIRIVHDFLALFIDQSNILKLPDSYDKNDGKTLKDALYLLYSPELCIYHKYSKKSYNKISTKINSSNVLGDENELIVQESAIEPSELNNKNCTNILLKELIQASLAIDIIPTLLSLKHLMKQSCSPFIKDVHKCIGELLKDYKNNLSSIIQDNTLIKELEYDFRMGLI